MNILKLRQEALDKFCNEKTIQKYVIAWNNRIERLGHQRHYRWYGNDYDRLRTIDLAFLLYLRTNKRKILTYKGSWPKGSANEPNIEHSEMINLSRSTFDYIQDSLSTHLNAYNELKEQCIGTHPANVTCRNIPAYHARLNTVLRQFIDKSIPYSESLAKSLG